MIQEMQKAIGAYREVLRLRNRFKCSPRTPSTNLQPFPLGPKKVFGGSICGGSPEKYMLYLMKIQQQLP
ncbi:hypothetical protein K7X08_036870 [Anisodus acutangulus]|uniref:Uncharacterized protein n=1 Tax=Anisodus acutangulus TaxID=402998 RepID=A0A9Q1QV94_9SOLA|nr:hypothetical protein K7X08_036870 [Anisodus acutangulus]